MWSKFYSVRADHPGSTILCLGSGPSMKDFDLDRLRGRGPVIAVNSMALMAPWADYVFFGDSRWWRWNGELARAACTGRIISTGQSTLMGGEVLRMSKDYQNALAPKRDELAGLDSGRQAINLAVHLGAKKIVIAGYDMGWAEGEASHGHTEFPHPDESVLKNYTDKFAPAYEPVVAELGRRGIDVCTITPSPRLPFIPLRDLDEAAPLLRHGKVSP